MHVKTIHRCRVCGNENLIPVIDLGLQYLQGSFVKEGAKSPPLRKLPLKLVRCDVHQNEDGCGLVQLAHTFPPDILYANYWYRSGTNETMRSHLHEIATEGMALLGHRAKNDNIRVLDIGCNDGTLLDFYPKFYTKYGVDPSDIAKEIESPTTVINTVFPSPEALATIGRESIDIITSIAMFYDLDAPVDFARAIKSLLAPGGIWALEMSYLPLMLARNSFDTICHEHLEYYSLDALEYIMKKAGLKVFKVSLNEINGGSIRIWVTHEDFVDVTHQSNMRQLSALRIREFDMELDTEKPYQQFKSSIESLKNRTMELLTRIRSEGKTIHIYGASTKGNVLLQWYGLNRLWIQAASDRNPDKNGAFTLGTQIPIIDEAASRSMKPDYYLVLPWHFMDEFLRRERATIMAGTRMIFPLPTLLVVDRNNVDEMITKLGAKDGNAINTAEQAVMEYNL